MRRIACNHYGLHDACLLTQFRRRQASDAIERETAPGEEVIDASEHERAAMARLILHKLGSRQPECPQYAAIQLALSREIADLARECDPQEASARDGIGPEIDAGQCLRSKAPGGLFKRLARDRLGERLARFQMTRGLVQHDAPGDPFLYQQESIVTYDDCGHRDIGFYRHGR